MSTQRNYIYEFGPFRVDTKERVLLREGRPVALTPKAFEVLLALVTHRGHIVEKDALLNHVWAGSFVEEGNLKVTVSMLRKALGQEGAEGQYIETVPRRGYRFAAEVRELPGEDLFVYERTKSTLVIEEEDRSNGRDQGQALTAANADEPEANRFAVAGQPSVTAVLARRSLANASSDSSSTSRTMPRLKIIGAMPFRKSLVLALGLALAAGVFLLLHERGKKAQANAATPFAFGSFSWQKLSNDDKGGPVLISPDGEFIVYVKKETNGASSVRMRRLNSDETVTVLPPSNKGGWGMTLTHDGSFLYYTLAGEVPDTGTLYKVSVLGGQPRKVLEGINSAATLSPDDSRVAFMRSDAKRNLISLINANASDGSDERVIESNDNGPTLIQPVWSPDGTRIACFVRERKPEGNYWSLVEIPSDGGPIKGITTPRRQQIWWFGWMSNGQGFIMNATDTASGKVQIYYVSYPSGDMTRITNDLNQYSGFSVNAAGNILVAAQMERESSIYLAHDNDPRTAIKITTTACCPDALDWTADGRIVFDAIDNGHRHLWIMNSDGGGQQRLSPEKIDDWQPSVSPDGRYLVFLSNRSGARELWRTDLDGRNPRQLTYGSDSLWLAGISADGQWVYYTQYQGGMRVLLQAAVDGGAATQITNVQTDLWSISPDGKLLAFSFFDERQQRKRVAIQALDGSAPTYFDIAPNDILRWTQDGKALIYKDSDPKVDVDSTLWQQPIAGGRPHPLLTWPDQISYWAVWSRDGHSVAVVRGRQIANMVMLKQQGQ